MPIACWEISITPIGDQDKAIAEYASLYSDHPKDPQVVKNYVQLLIVQEPPGRGHPPE